MKSSQNLVLPIRDRYIQRLNNKESLLSLTLYLSQTVSGVNANNAMIFRNSSGGTTSTLPKCLRAYLENNNNNNNNNDLITAYLQGSSTSANLINITILLKYLLIIFRVGNVR